MAPTLISLPEYCRMNRYSYLRVWNLVTRGELEARRVGLRWYLNPDAKPPTPSRAAK